MSHLFRLMYSDEIMNIKCQFNREELIAAITTELIKRKISSLDVKGKQLLSLPEERSLWWKFSSHAKMSIGEEQGWKLILEAFKLLNYQVSQGNCRQTFEQIFHSSYLELHAIHSDINRTASFKNLLDYLE